MTQIVTRVPEELIDAVDGLVEGGFVGSRSEAVRVALAELVDRHRRTRTGQEIVAGYTQFPQEDADGLWSDRVTVEMIAEEPW